MPSFNFDLLDSLLKGRRIRVVESTANGYRAVVVVKDLDMVEREYEITVHCKESLVSNQ